jgi:hypothetical protein
MWRQGTLTSQTSADDTAIFFLTVCVRYAGIIKTLKPQDIMDTSSSLSFNGHTRRMRGVVDKTVAGLDMVNGR